MILLKFGGKLIEGYFVKRLNRFEAIIKINDVENLVHVPNTGRLKELLVEGATVLVKKYSNPNRKTRYGLKLVLKDGIWVSIDSANVPNSIVNEALMKKYFSQFASYNIIKKEYSIGNSRFDFGLFKENEECYIEVKGVTLVNDRIACFPDAPTERGVKHLEELIRLKQDGKNTSVIFVIQREDADIFMPNDIMDPKFGKALREAYNTGVKLFAYRCIVNSNEIVFDAEIPVMLG